VISIENITKQYGKFTAVDQINLHIKKGEIFGFLGPNGAGKTTTLKMMTGLLKINTGRISIGGFDIAKAPLEVKKLIGYIPDRPYIYEKLSGKEFLDFIAGIYHISYEKKEAKIKNLFQLFELDKWADELIESYSLGMKQKLVMAANILHDPEVYIVDEPMVGLDPKSARIVKEIFIDLGKAGKTLFISTHSLEIVETLCNSIGIIMNGKIIAKGTLKEVKEMAKTEKTGLEDIFLSLTGAPDLSNVLAHIK